MGVKKNHATKCPFLPYLYVLVYHDDLIFFYSVSRKDIQTGNVMAVGEVTCLVIDRE